MIKTVLVTGSTDGIGLVTANSLALAGHKVIIHGRNQTKIDRALSELNAQEPNVEVQSYCGDLSDLKAVAEFGLAIKDMELDVLINNAGVYSTTGPYSSELDPRFVVNTYAPYFLTKQLVDVLPRGGRIVNVASAAQAPVDFTALRQANDLPDSTAYAMSKLALIMWTNYMAKQHPELVFVSVNPKSLLGSKMVKEAYGVSGADVSIGADILIRAAVSDEFAQYSGSYFDNDIEQFAAAHPDSANAQKCEQIVLAMEEALANIVSS